MKLSWFVKDGDHLFNNEGIPPLVGTLMYIRDYREGCPINIKTYKIVDVCLSTSLTTVDISMIRHKVTATEPEQVLTQIYKAIEELGFGQVFGINFAEKQANIVSMHYEIILELVD